MLPVVLCAIAKKAEANEQGRRPEAARISPAGPRLKDVQPITKLNGDEIPATRPTSWSSAWLAASTSTNDHGLTIEMPERPSGFQLGLCWGKQVETAK